MYNSVYVRVMFWLCKGYVNVLVRQQTIGEVVITKGSKFELRSMKSATLSILQPTLGITGSLINDPVIAACQISDYRVIYQGYRVQPTLISLLVEADLTVGSET